MATLKDISRALQLSVTQVSRALNDHSDVNEETRRRVKEAAKLLKYQPNVTARKLASGRSGMVGLVVPYNSHMASDGMWLEVVSGLSAQFSGQGMQFVLHIAQRADAVLPTYQKLISSGSLDGFVLLDPGVHDRRITFLAAEGVPFVVHGRSRAPADYAFFDIDNFGLAQESTARLLALGHRRIAYINGQEQRSYAEARTAGYQAALQAAGVSFDPDLLRYGMMEAATGLVNAVQMFGKGVTRPTAVICSNVLIARGIYQALDALGLQIPGDVSVIAHDDDLIGQRAAAFFPALTVTQSPLRDSWAPLARFLSGAIQGKPLAELQEVRQYTFIEHASVAAARR